MAKKSLNPLEDPPTASSSDDEEVGSSAGEEDDDVSSSDEDNNSPVKSAPPPPPPSTKPAATKPVSDSESGSETETDSDSEPEQPPNPTPVVTVATTTATKPKTQNQTQDTSATLALPAVKSTKKRPSEGTSSREANPKRAKNGDGGGEDTKKPAFQRLWTEEDEIAVLQGMIDFKNDTGKSPYDDTNVFYEFIKQSISFEVSKNQFMDKIRSLKKKYMGKEKNGAEKVFLKAHDKKSLALSKFIWGPEGMGLESAVKSNGVSKKSQTKTKKAESAKAELFASPNGKQVEEEKVVEVEPQEKTSDWFDKSFIAKSLAGFGVDEQYVKQKWRMVPDGNKKKIEEELKDLQNKEFEFVMQKSKFLHEVAAMIAEAAKK